MKISKMFLAFFVLLFSASVFAQCCPGSCCGLKSDAQLNKILAKYQINNTIKTSYTFLQTINNKKSLLPRKKQLQNI